MKGPQVHISFAILLATCSLMFFFLVEFKKHILCAAEVRRTRDMLSVEDKGSNAESRQPTPIPDMNVIETLSDEMNDEGYYEDEGDG